MTIEDGNISSMLILICFPFLWGLVSWILSIAGGWAALSQQYEINDFHPKNAWQNWKSISTQRVVLFPVNYGNCVKMSVDDEALYLSVFMIFRIGHPTLKLPYNEMEAETKKILFWNVTKIRMMKAPKIQLTLQKKDVKYLLEKIEG